MPADLKQVAEAASAALEAWAAAKLMNSRAAEQHGPHCFQSATEATMKSLLRCTLGSRAAKLQCSRWEQQQQQQQQPAVCFF